VRRGLKEAGAQSYEPTNRNSIKGRDTGESAFMPYGYHMYEAQEKIWGQPLKGCLSREKTIAMQEK
jgi:hypothetical protein